MKPRLLLSVAFGIVLIAAAVFWIQRDSVNAPSPPSENAQDLPLSAEEISVVGEVICLPHKDTSGPQTLECAIGIKDDAGSNYALYANDPTETGSLPTGSEVEIIGMLQEAEPTSKYDTVGTLHVRSVKQL